MDAFLTSDGLIALVTLTAMEVVLETDHTEGGGARGGAFAWVLVQIVLLDIVFSLDSVITAVGMANQLSIMIAAMVLAMLVMLAAAGSVSAFVDRHPSVKILALSF